MGVMDGKSHCSSLQLLFLTLLFLGLLFLRSINGDPGVHCIESERRALLKFKEGLTDPSGRLSSWVGDHCCRWRGVSCSNRTGSVVKLNLRNTFLDHNYDYMTFLGTTLGGELSPSLLSLKFLNYLDLSMNNFNGFPIPTFMGSLGKLRYLNLLSSSFGGTIPPHLGNLSRLYYLDLHANFDIKSDFKWLSGLSSLRYLDMGYVTLVGYGGVGLIQVINMLPSLLEVHLSSCGLPNLPLALPFLNFTSLTVLDISSNNLNSSIPLWLFNITSLVHLDLSYNFFGGPFPDAFSHMISLQILDLSFNAFEGVLPRTLGHLCQLRSVNLWGSNFSGEVTKFVNGLSNCSKNSLEIFRARGNRITGQLPASIGRLSSLKELDISDNQMNGTIPKSIGQLSELVVLDLSKNSWAGVISNDHLVHLRKLRELYISSTSLESSLAFELRYDWVPPFRLEIIQILDVQLGPTFPAWLRTQKQLSFLVLSNVGISSNIPAWFWKLSSLKMNYLDLSKNQLKGTVPNLLNFHHECNVYLSSNQLEGPIPLWSNVTLLYLGHNSFSGPIPSNISKMMPRLAFLDLSSNFLNGSIPSSIGKLKDLSILVLSNNQLSGKLPHEWTGIPRLDTLDLSNNNLFGEIPLSMGSLTSLRYLLLSNNSLCGELPSSLENCTSLESLDLGGNRFFGNIPIWLGERLPLTILRLRSNMFSRKIPRQLCYLTLLHILDLAHNNLSGYIPRCFNNFTSMIPVSGPVAYGYSYDEKTKVVAKGRELEYSKSSNLDLVKAIDLSGNNLSGEIPKEMTSLLGLGTLNLSSNQLTGQISEEIGNLRWLETLDLSKNQLSGPIPFSMSSLTFLSNLNLSYNNLSGKIPSGNQLQTLDDKSIYMHNPRLCGPPLSTRCSSDETSQGQGLVDGEEEDIDEFETLWFYVSMAPGFVVGFWTVCGTLLLKKSWRYAYFQFCEDLVDKLFVLFTVNMAHLQGKMRFERN